MKKECPVWFVFSFFISMWTTIFLFVIYSIFQTQGQFQGYGLTPHNVVVQNQCEIVRNIARVSDSDCEIMGWVLEWFFDETCLGMLMGPDAFRGKLGKFLDNIFLINVTTEDGVMLLRRALAHTSFISINRSRTKYTCDDYFHVNNCLTKNDIDFSLLKQLAKRGGRSHLIREPRLRGNDTWQQRKQLQNLKLSNFNQGSFEPNCPKYRSKSTVMTGFGTYMAPSAPQFNP